MGVTKAEVQICRTTEKQSVALTTILGKMFETERRIYLCTVTSGMAIN